MSETNPKNEAPASAYAPSGRMNVGGQAVLEGVMMRSPKCFAVAVRRKSGAIVIREQPWKAAWAGKAAKVPLVRGAITLFESMQNGYSALRFSADQMEIDLAEEQVKSALADQASSGGPTVAAYRAGAESVTKQEKVNAEVAAAAVTADAATGGASGAGTRLATVLAIGFFIALPQLLAWLVGRWAGPGFGLQSFWFHALTGAFKLALVLGYLLMIRRVPEVRRVFQYHGAEHKAIATYEAGEPLTVEYARRHSTRHARCGTTFLIVVVIVSVFAYAAILPPLLQGISGGAAQLAAIVLKVLMLPLIAGISYELQRLGARFSGNPLAAILLTPGYWVQSITTIEPSDEQLEIALASLRVTLVREEASRRGEWQPADEPLVQTFDSYASFADAYGGLAFTGTG